MVSSEDSHPEETTRKVHTVKVFCRIAKMSLQCADVELQYKNHKDLKREDVKKLQEWLQMQAHLPPLTELEVILFLYSCYGSNEAAKITIDNYFTVRTHCPEFFSKRSPTCSDVQQTLKTTIIVPLPKLTPEGYCIMYAKLIDPNPDSYVFNNKVKVFDMSGSIFLRERGAMEGHIIIIDLSGATLTHVMKTGPMAMKKYLFFLQEALPFRIKGLHFTSAVPFMDKIIALIKPFMKKELMDILQIHQSNSDTIFKSIPRDCLPNEIGGTLGSDLEMNANFCKKINANAAFFAAEEKMLVDESKRPGKPKNAGDLFGVEGTFKKLDID